MENTSVLSKMDADEEESLKRKKNLVRKRGCWACGAEDMEEDFNAIMR